MADWNQLYGVWEHGKFKENKPLTRTLLSPDEYQALIGKHEGVPELKPAHEWGGTQLPRFILPLEDFKSIMGSTTSPMDRFPGSEEKMTHYLLLLSEAFRIFAIDTAEAQSLFLAHAAGESSAFAKFTEGQQNDALYEDDPANVQVDALSSGGPVRYAGWGDIDPMGVIHAGSTVVTAPDNKTTFKPTMDPKDFDKTFIGRAPVQVTFRYGYIQALVYMQEASEWVTGAGDSATVVEAMNAIKGEPREAARAKYTFLFATAYMHMSGMVQASPYGFTEAGMSGGFTDNRGDIKTATYARALAYLQGVAKDYKAGTS